MINIQYMYINQAIRKQSYARPLLLYQLGNSIDLIYVNQTKCRERRQAIASAFPDDLPQRGQITI